MDVKKVKIANLIKDPSNVRLHNDKNLMAIKGSLLKFGQQKPIVVNSMGIVIAGNGTLEAAISLGWDDIYIVMSELSGIDLTAYAIADNRTSEIATWDNDGLQKILSSLSDMDFDLRSIGFDFGDNSIPDFDPNLPDENNLKENKMSITILCKSFDEQQELFSELNGRGYKVKI